MNDHREDCVIRKNNEEAIRRLASLGGDETLTLRLILPECY